MSIQSAQRPYTRVYLYDWMDGDDPIPGIIFRNGARVSLHVTPAEAYELSNLLVDLAERLEDGETPICSQTTSAPGDTHQIIVPASARHTPRQE